MTPDEKETLTKFERWYRLAHAPLTKGQERVMDALRAALRAPAVTGEADKSAAEIARLTAALTAAHAAREEAEAEDTRKLLLLTAERHTSAALRAERDALAAQLATHQQP